MGVTLGGRPVLLSPDQPQPETFFSQRGSLAATLPPVSDQPKQVVEVFPSPREVDAAPKMEDRNPRNSTAYNSQHRPENTV